MISLFIDTSNSRLVIGLINENKNEIISYYNEKVNNDISSKIFGVIENCVDGSGYNPKDIDKIYVATGPGSFTGVRIGVTIAKTFAWSLNVKVIPISSLEILASS